MIIQIVDDEDNGHANDGWPLITLKPSKAKFAGKNFMSLLDVESTLMSGFVFTFI